MGRYFMRKTVILLLFLYALKLTSYSFFCNTELPSKIESVFKKHIETVTAMGSSLLDISE